MTKKEKRSKIDIFFKKKHDCPSNFDSPVPLTFSPEIIISLLTPLRKGSSNSLSAISPILFQTFGQSALQGLKLLQLSGNRFQSHHLRYLVTWTSLVLSASLFLLLCTGVGKRLLKQKVDRRRNSFSRKGETSTNETENRIYRWDVEKNACILVVEEMTFAYFADTTKRLFSPS